MSATGGSVGATRKCQTEMTHEAAPRARRNRARDLRYDNHIIAVMALYLCGYRHPGRVRDWRFGVGSA
jgi:hypothetical protein